MNINLKDAQKEVHQLAKDKGFWSGLPCNNHSAAKLMLIVSELAEAMEADRKGDRVDMVAIDQVDTSEEKFNAEFFEHYIKNKFEDELADAMIRIMDLAEFHGIDLEAHIRAKHAYNKQRPYKHGKNY